MNKLLAITVLVTLLALNAESFRVPRNVEEEVEGPLTKLTNSFRSYYDGSVDSASEYLNSIRGIKLEEKIKNMYDDTTRAVSTYFGIIQDQLYHHFYGQS